MSVDLQNPSPTLYSRKFSRLILFWWVVFIFFILALIIFSIISVEDGDSYLFLLVMLFAIFGLISLIINSLILFEYKCCMEDLCEIEDPICKEYVEKISRNKVFYLLGIPLSFFCLSILTMIPVTFQMMPKKIKAPEPVTDIFE